MRGPGSAEPETRLLRMVLMKRTFHVFVCAAVVMAVALGAGCKSSNKRKPVLTDPSDPSSSRRGYSEPSAEPIDNGAGLERLPRDGITESDLTEEGGPLADVRFEYDSAALTTVAQDLLRGHASWLKDNPHASVAIEGHCDERGTVEYNLALGEQRSRTVLEFLTGLGVNGSRLRTVSFGKERPLDTGQGEESWARNRRAHFSVSGSN
jgi:peptidoglycan-associated lipoprotein